MNYRQWKIENAYFCLLYSNYLTFSFYTKPYKVGIQNNCVNYLGKRRYKFRIDVGIEY